MDVQRNDSESMDIGGIQDGGMDTKSIWFWATTFGYFLHPLAHFQYMSLLFGKPEPLHQQSVNVTLNATECYGVSDDFMLLLTQRVSC
jgi:hypothetical protein